MQPSNVLHIVSLSDGWCDKDEVMLHACFQLLTDCVEKEHLLDGTRTFQLDEESKLARVQIEELYEWWTKRKVNYYDKNVLPDDEFELENKMLTRLINIRGYLWT